MPGVRPATRGSACSPRLWRPQRDWQIRNLRTRDRRGKGHPDSDPRTARVLNRRATPLHTIRPMSLPVRYFPNTFSIRTRRPSFDSYHSCCLRACFTLRIRCRIRIPVSTSMRISLPICILPLINEMYSYCLLNCSFKIVLLVHTNVCIHGSPNSEYAPGIAGVTGQQKH
jgi:hypothetical protein